MQCRLLQYFSILKPQKMDLTLIKLKVNEKNTVGMKFQKLKKFLG